MALTKHDGVPPDNGPVAATGASGGVGGLVAGMFPGLGYEVTAITGRAKEHGHLEILAQA